MSLHRRLLLSIGAGLAAFLINLFPVPVFTGVMFYFGGALYVCAGIVLGPIYGVLAAVISNIPLNASWTQISLLFLFPVEAAVVAWAVRRHSIQPVVADFVFRFCAVLPWSITIYDLDLASMNPEIWVMVVRYVLNGVMIALIAEVLISAGVMNYLIGDRKLASRRFKGYLVYNFILVAVVPLLLLSIIHERQYTKKLRTEAASRTLPVCRSISSPLKGR